MAFPNARLSGSYFPHSGYVLHYLTQDAHDIEAGEWVRSEPHRHTIPGDGFVSFDVPIVTGDTVHPVGVRHVFELHFDNEPVRTYRVYVEGDGPLPGTPQPPPTLDVVADAFGGFDVAYSAEGATVRLAVEVPTTGEPPDGFWLYEKPETLPAPPREWIRGDPSATVLEVDIPGLVPGETYVFDINSQHGRIESDLAVDMLTFEVPQPAPNAAPTVTLVEYGSESATVEVAFEPDPDTAEPMEWLVVRTTAANVIVEGVTLLGSARSHRFREVGIDVNYKYLVVAIVTVLNVVTSVSSTATTYKVPARPVPSAPGAPELVTTTLAEDGRSVNNRIQFTKSSARQIRAHELTAYLTYPDGHIVEDAIIPLVWTDSPTDATKAFGDFTSDLGVNFASPKVRGKDINGSPSPWSVAGVTFTTAAAALDYPNNLGAEIPHPIVPNSAAYWTKAGNVAAQNRANGGRAWRLESGSGNIRHDVHRAEIGHKYELGLVFQKDTVGSGGGYTLKMYEWDTYAHAQAGATPNRDLTVDQTSNSATISYQEFLYTYTPQYTFVQIYVSFSGTLLTFDFTRWRDMTDIGRPSTLSTSSKEIVGSINELYTSGAGTATTLASHTANTSNPHSTTAAQVGADPTGTASAAITTHVGLADPHTQYLLESDNLGSLASPSTALTNLGLQNVATLLGSVARNLISKAGTLIGTRRGLNFIEGANVTLIVADNSGSERVDVTVAATGVVTSVTGTAPIASSGGTTPAISISAASGAAAGSMSASDFTKLAGVATGATANDTDVNLKARANHTGTQSIITITGLPTVALAHMDAKTDVSGTFDIARNGSQRHNSYTEQTGTPAIGDAFEVQVFIAAGTYTLSVLGVTGSNGGIVKWQLDGVDVATGQDWYSAGFVFNVLKTQASIVVAANGVHTLKCVVTGKNASSSSYYARVTTVWLR